MAYSYGEKKTDRAPTHDPTRSQSSNNTGRSLAGRGVGRGAKQSNRSGISLSNMIRSATGPTTAQSPGLVGTVAGAFLPGAGLGMSLMQMLRQAGVPMQSTTPGYTNSLNPPAPTVAFNPYNLGAPLSPDNPNAANGSFNGRLFRRRTREAPQQDSLAAMQNGSYGIPSARTMAEQFLRSSPVVGPPIRMNYRNQPMSAFRNPWQRV